MATVEHSSYVPTENLEATFAVIPNVKENLSEQASSAFFNLRRKDQQLARHGSMPLVANFNELISSRREQSLHSSRNINPKGIVNQYNVKSKEYNAQPAKENRFTKLCDSLKSKRQLFLKVRRPQLITIEGTSSKGSATDRLYKGDDFSVKKELHHP